MPTDVDAVRVAHRTLAVDELAAWLRMNRTGGSWPATRYELEIADLAVRHLRGDGWAPDLGLTPRWGAVMDGVHEAGIGAWRIVVGTEPWEVVDTPAGGTVASDETAQ